MTARLLLPVVFLAALAAILLQWRGAVGFDPLDGRWWVWLWQTATHTRGLPDDLLWPVYWTGAAGFAALALVLHLSARAGARTLAGGRQRDDLHGSARWALWKDVKRAGLAGRRGVVVGGWKQWLGTRTLWHDGPEHVLAFARTRSGKGVGLVVPTLLTWEHSVLVLDIKGENHALTAGWRAQQGHRILRFEPTATAGSIRFNPLAEVRLGSGYDIADCQNIAAMVVDPEGKGLKDYWMQEGWSWLSVVLLHVLYRTRREAERTANLSDVNGFMSACASGGPDEDDFAALLEDMLAYDHGVDHVDREVRRGANRMKIKAPQERSGVHSSASVQLALYADPIVARNIADSDFRLDDLMNGPTPAALYIIVQPSDIDRLRPLIRVILNVFLRRLTGTLAFEDGRAVAGYRHRLLLMLDEFTSIGKLEIFERALAFMAGYGLKAFIIVQDMAQLQQAYGREESIMSNCHVRIAYAPNRVETAKVLSDMTGKQTVVQMKRARSARPGEIGSVSDSLAETSRPLLTADECMRLKGMERRPNGRVIPGDMLIFAAGTPPILGRQRLYFRDKDLLRRARVPAPQPVPAPSHDNLSFPPRTEETS
ncbi:conjugal transfer protein TraG [Magnetospira thiophila]